MIEKVESISKHAKPKQCIKGPAITYYTSKTQRASWNPQILIKWVFLYIHYSNGELDLSRLVFFVVFWFFSFWFSFFASGCINSSLKVLWGVTAMRAADPVIWLNEEIWRYHGKSWISQKDAVVAGQGLPLTPGKRFGTNTQLSLQID